MDMTEPKVCKITMAGFVTELMAECTDISGTADTPSTTALFEISPTAALLGERTQRFHSLVAKLLYLGKRSRPDMTTVAFLSTQSAGRPGGLEEASEACALPAWHGRLGIRQRPTNRGDGLRGCIIRSAHALAQRSGHLPRARACTPPAPAAHQHQVEHGGRARRGVRRLRPE
jgi:hypothetical protein